MLKKNKKLVIFGTGEIGCLAHYYFTHDSDYKVVAFTADEEYVTTNQFKGLPFIPINQLSDIYPPDEYVAHVALSFMKLNETRAEKYYMLNCSRQTRLLGRWAKLSRELNENFYLDFIKITKKRLVKGIEKLNRKDLRLVYAKLMPGLF